MTTPNAVLADAFDRLAQTFPAALKDLSADQLLWRPAPDANPIAWLAWHAARVEDDHIAGVSRETGGNPEQVWTSQKFADRFALPYPTDALGYGQSSKDLAAFTVSDPQLLADYYAAVHARTAAFVQDFADFDTVVDRAWDPPVTAAARLVSVVNDVSQHVGQMAYIRGLALQK